MSSEIIDKPRFSLFSEELRFPTRQGGFWKMESVPDHRGEGMTLMSESQSDSSLLGKLQSAGSSTMESSEILQPDALKDQKIEFNMENHLVGARNGTSPSAYSWRDNGHNSGLKSKMSMRPFSMEGNKVDLTGLPYENGLFSSSLSDLLDRKLNLSSNIAFLNQSAGTINSNFEEDEFLEPLEEIEAQTIGNLLPDNDDLLSGLIDDIGYIAQPNCGDDIDDDIFCTGGGMELGGNGNSLNASELINGGGSNGLHVGLNSQFAGEHQYGEQHSRTLFVRNINGNVEDSELKVLFEQYGDIRTLYTTCKHRGFVMISYYDIRAAKNAMRLLQSKSLRSRKLDLHYYTPKVNPSEKDVNQGTLTVFNLDSSVSNDVLHQLFGVYGEIKEICETPHKQQHKFIEFYDVRAAEAALHALNRTDIAGNKIYLEPSHPSGARWCLSTTQQLVGTDFTRAGAGSICVYKQGRSPNSSPAAIFGSLPLGAITSGFDKAVGAPISPLLDSTFKGISLSVPHKLSSPVNVSSVGNHNNLSGHGENGSSLGQMKSGFQSMPVMHPNSLPEYHAGLANGITYNSSSTMSAMAMNISCRPGEGIDNRYIQGVGSGSLTSPSFERGNGSCPVHGHKYISKAYPHHSSGPTSWGNSPPFINNFPSQYPPRLHGFPGVPSHMLNAVLPMHSHHVGSSPTVNPAIWEQRKPYIGDPTDISSLHPGSLGNMRFSGTSPMHPLERASRNIIDHVGIPLPQQMCHIFQGGNHLIPMPAPFDVPNDWIRSRRSDSNANQVDNKKQFELDIQQIIRGEDSRTTLMIKNIPNKYTSKMLLAAIDEHHKGAYDFIYLPIDFNNKCNVGYAFINMIDPQQIIPFFQAFNGKKWEKFNSEKVASLAYARIQGKPALIAHFQNSSLMNEDKRCRPILFHSDGPNAGDQEPFPMGSNIRSRPGRSKTYPNEVSPSTSPNGTGFSNT